MNKKLKATKQKSTEKNTRSEKGRRPYAHTASSTNCLKPRSSLNVGKEE